MTAQNYDFTVKIGGAAWVQAPGRFVYYLKGDAGGFGVAIRVKHVASGLFLTMLPGQAFELPESALVGDSWQIENYDKQATISGILVIGLGNFKDNRISGEVSVIDGGKRLSLGGVTGFASVPFGYTPNVGWYSNMIINNGSQKNFVLNQLTMQGIVNARGEALGGAVILKSTVNSDTTLIEVGGWESPTVASKMVGLSITGVSIYKGCNQTRNSFGSNYAGQFYLSPTQPPVVFKPTEPIVIPPGKGLGVLALEPNMTFSLTAEGYFDSWWGV